MNSLQLRSIEQFCKAAKAGGFTSAAESLGLTPAAVSRSISRLEEHLGVRFSRRIALERIAEAERAITGGQTVPSGPLQISIGAAYGTFRLLPLMPKFTELYSQIDIEISISDKIIDFMEEVSILRFD
jgi:DNA-binding transcriptional LysR family regulator